MLRHHRVDEGTARKRNAAHGFRPSLIVDRYYNCICASLISAAIKSSIFLSISDGKEYLDSLAS